MVEKDRRPLGCSLRPQQLSAGRDGAMNLQRIARCSRPFMQRQLLCVADPNFLASSEGISALATAPEEQLCSSTCILSKALSSCHLAM